MNQATTIFSVKTENISFFTMQPDICYRSPHHTEQSQYVLQLPPTKEHLRIRLLQTEKSFPIACHRTKRETPMGQCFVPPLTPHLRALKLNFMLKFKNKKNLPINVFL